MPSFDVVSKLDMQEVDNAVNQAGKEINQRYDFKGSKSEISHTEDAIVIISDDDYKLKVVIDVLQSKLVKRSVSLKSLSYGAVEPATGGLVRQKIELVQGIPIEKAKQMVKYIKSTKIKVQSQIQGDQLRISGKKRDLLQECIALLKEKDYGVDLQFVNFRE